MLFKFEIAVFIINKRDFIKDEQGRLHILCKISRARREIRRHDQVYERSL